MRKLEEIAAAMCAQCAAEFGGPAKLEDSPAREAWISSARAAVRAMREPSAAQIRAIDRAIHKHWPTASKMAVAAHEAAIDAILSEEDGE